MIYHGFDTREQSLLVNNFNYDVLTVKSRLLNFFYYAMPEVQQYGWILF